jgi:hypothetical protein
MLHLDSCMLTCLLSCLNSVCVVAWIIRLYIHQISVITDNLTVFSPIKRCHRDWQCIWPWWWQ